MADEAIDFERLRLSFDDNSSLHGESNYLSGGNCRFYVGQLIALQISLPLTAIGQKKLKTSHAEKSPFVQNLFISFMRQLSSTIELKYSFKPYADVAQKKLTKDQGQWLDCKLLSTYHEAFCPENLKGQPFLSEDKSTYHIPLQVQIPDLSSQCSTVQLEVQARSVSRHIPNWLSSPTRTEPGSIFQQEPGVCQNLSKSVTLPLRIIHPPQLKFQQTSVAGKHMVFLQLKNSSAFHCMKVDECVILPESCSKSSKSVTCFDCKTQHLQKKLGCSQHVNMVKRLSGAVEMFDNLSPSECYTLCYLLNTTEGIENLAKEDLSLEVHIKWDIPYQQQGKHASVQTTYRLPILKVKQAPFVMNASVEESTIKKGKSFTVQYKITNKLQDFLSITLNWNPSQPGSTGIDDLRRRKFQDGLLCQDPCIELGPCSYGSTLQAKVRFEATTTGVYEVCKHMKINLRYLIPSSETVSLGSPCSQTSEDLLCVAAEDLWRSRSESGSSFNDFRAWNFPEQENKWAYKSYSSGDLGPDVQITDYDSGDRQRSRFEDRPTMPRLDVPHSSKFEQILLSPSNFLKSSCQIYVR